MSPPCRQDLENASDISREMLRVAHTLGGISATTGLRAVQGVAHALELAFERMLTADAAPDEPQRMLLARAVGALDGMVGAIAELRLPAPEAGLTAELDGLMPACRPAAGRQSEEIRVFELPPHRSTGGVFRSDSSRDSATR